MINAVPSNNSKSDAKPPAMPHTPAKPSSTRPENQHFPDSSSNNQATHHDSVSTPSTTHPDLQTHSPSTTATASAPHGQTGRFSDELARKVQGKDAATPNSGGMPTQPPFNPTYPDKTLEEINQSNQGGSHFGRNAILSALVLGLVIAGSGASYYLMQQNQDIRQQAASEEVTQTEQVANWTTFNSGWQNFMADTSHTWEDYVAYAQGAGARYGCEEPIMTVGEETLYGCDLNALFVIYEPQTYIQAGSISPQDSKLNSVLDGLITNSALLQEGQNQDVITLSSNIYNSPNKDTLARFAAVKSMRELFADQFEKRVDFEAVVIYFHNQVEPQIPLAEAQAAAKAKMDVLYQRLQSGEITMKEAGAEIAADNIIGDTTGVSLALLDTLYDKNAYVAHEGHKFNSRIFKDPVYDDELRSLGEGQMSTVRLCKDYKFTNEEFQEFQDSEEGLQTEMVDSCYIIFKVNKIDLGLLPQDSAQQDVESYLQADYEKKTTVMEEKLQQ